MTTLPPRHTNLRNKKIWESKALSQVGWSGKRDSNSRPIPWQGIALPTELFPQKSRPHYRDIAHAVKKIGRVCAYQNACNAMFSPHMSHLCIMRRCATSPISCRIPALLHLARVVKLVDTRDLKSLGEKSLYRFDSGPGHHQLVLYCRLTLGNQRALLEIAKLLNRLQRDS